MVAAVTSSDIGQKNAEDIIGQAVRINREIAAIQAYNKTWWADWFIDDAWDDVRPIRIPGM